MTPLVNTLLIIFVIILLVIIQLLRTIRPSSKLTSHYTPTEFGLEYEKVEFKTQDKVTLRGWFVKNKKSKKAIIICHGYPADKTTVLPMTWYLAKKYNLLYFDFRSFGESKGRYTTIGFHEQKDFRAAVDYLKRRGFKSMGAIGFSLGAATILMENGVKAVVADSPYSSLYKMLKRTYAPFIGIIKMPFVWLTELLAYIFFGINIRKVSPAKSAAKIKEPILYIHGTNDSQIPHSDSVLLDKVSPNSKLWLVPNTDHCLAHHDYPKEYEKKVLGFFTKHL